jgi:Lsr2
MSSPRPRNRPTSMGNESRRPPGLREEVAVLADLLVIGLLKAEIRALNALRAALPAGAPRQTPAADAEPPAPLEASAGRRGDEPVDGRPTHTVRFGLDGRQYEIDLSGHGAAEFREAVQRYVDAARVIRTPSRSRGRQPGTGSRRSTAAPPPNDSSAVRHWARANGYPVSDRGRIAASVLAAYEARE